jgi:uncharacterized Zn-binding protein involved in type VI secretion
LAIVHRNNDLRDCGASTIASQSKLSIGGQPVALVGDVESHGDGAFNPNGVTVTFSGKSLIRVGDSATVDSLLHADTQAVTGFSKFSIS